MDVRGRLNVELEGIVYFEIKPFLLLSLKQLPARYQLLFISNENSKSKTFSFYE
jgi:hypothetical protein